MQGINKKGKLILAFSLLINLFFVIAGSYTIQKLGGFHYLILKLYYNVYGITGSTRHIHRRSHFELLPNTKDEIIFLGDSITMGCEWAELFQNANIKNRGIDGDDMEKIFARLPEIIESEPAKIFLMAGANDIPTNTDISDLAAKYHRIIDFIRHKSHKTNIFIQSLLPVNNKIHTSKRKNTDIIKLNKKLSSFADNQHIYYIDLFSAFTDKNGRLDKAFTHDGIHLNGQGYLVWKSLIQSYLK